MSEHAERRTLSMNAEEILRQRADSLARESFEEEATDRLSLLLFRIAEEWYAVQVSDVREIFQEYELTPIPGVPAHISGVVNVRGEILSVTDPAKLMGIGAIDTDVVLPPAIVIVHDDVATALVVDEIGDIAEVSCDAVEPPVSIIDRHQAEFISGSVHVDEGMVGLISVERVLEPVSTGVRH